uniref:Uncharacterized protein n=1 Tax=Eucampia antarctica TaxID=49252 RepID=A0A7S2S8B1_9STRA|mmetsp:Transcript_4470/g.4234  ORF Transcript_4470/g.4234 Transcript_4470/m.4234 type:complete len:303 (+) Transcript_4470:206-1114(+)
MRFLLYKLPIQTTRKVGVQLSVATQKKIDTPSTKMTLWGQQCSSTCGCVVRFDVNVDNQNRISDISFSSKTVVTTHVKNRNSEASLQPVMTSRHNQPLLKTCKCSTLNKFAEQAVIALKQKSPLHLARAQNMLECVGIRSSKAMRSVALHNFNFNPRDTHCYDVVEEALTACLKGHMPLPRYRQTVNLGQPREHKNAEEREANDNRIVNPLRIVQAAKRAGIFFPSISSTKYSSSSMMPASHLQNKHNVYSRSTTLKKICEDFAHTERENHSDTVFLNSSDYDTLDWETYVDERNQCESLDQ